MPKRPATGTGMGMGTAMGTGTEAQPPGLSIPTPVTAHAAAHQCAWERMMDRARIEACLRSHALSLRRCDRERPRFPMICFPLRIAAGDEEQTTRQSSLRRIPGREAAGFFIEQILLFPDADSYRVLGANPKWPPANSGAIWRCCCGGYIPTLTPRRAIGFCWKGDASLE